MTLSEIASAVADVAAQTVSVAQGVYSFITGGLADVGDALYSAGSYAQQHIGFGLDDVQRLIDDAVTPLREGFNEALIQTGEFLGGVIQGITGWIGGRLDWLAGVNESIQNYLWDDLAPKLVEVETQVRSVAGDVNEYLSPKLEQLLGVVQGIPISIEHFISALLGGVLTLGGIMDKFNTILLKKIDSLFDLTPENMKKFSDSFAETFRELQDKMK